jgi:hypothetical protein
MYQGYTCLLLMCIYVRMLEMCMYTMQKAYYLLCYFPAGGLSLSSLTFTFRLAASSGMSGIPPPFLLEGSSSTANGVCRSVTIFSQAYPLSASCLDGPYFRRCWEWCSPVAGQCQDTPWWGLSLHSARGIVLLGIPLYCIRVKLVILNIILLL